MSMVQEFARLAVQDFPSELHDDVARYLSYRSVGLAALVIAGNRESSTQVGSGTLVYVGGRHAVLTADHVVEQLLEAPRMGMFTDFTGRLRRISFDLDRVAILRLGNRGYGPDGPDLALIFLPKGENLDRLLANKVFHNLDRRIVRAPYAPVEMGFWFVCGLPTEGTYDMGPVGPFGNVRAVQAMCSIAANPFEISHADYDFLEMKVPIEGPDLPKALYGVSGSGVWQVLVRKGLDGVIRIDDHILSGVAFYEWPAPHRLMRSHGRRSLYEKLPVALAAWSAG